MAGCTQINCQTQEIRKIKKKADLILKNKKGVKKVKKREYQRIKKVVK